MTTRIFTIFTFLLVLFILMGCQSEEKESYDIAILNGQVIDLESGKVEEKDIFIFEGSITKIGNADSVGKFESKQTIDASGKFLLPGFWDNHVHFRGGDSLVKSNKNFLKLFIANGITTVRDAGGDLTGPVTQWKSEIENGHLIGPTIFTSGPKIDGPNATWAGSLEVENDIDINNALDVLQRIPVDYVKLYDSRISGKNYLNTIAEAEKRGLITSGHMPFSVTLEETIAAGIDGIEHLYYIMKGCSADEREITQKLVDGEIGFWDAMPLLRKSYSDSTASKTFQYLKNNGVFVTPTLHIGKTLSYLDEVDHSNDPYLDYMGKGIIKTYKGRINRVKNATSKTLQDRKELDTFFGTLAKSLNDAGVALLAGSDSGAYNSYTYPGMSLHKELQEMVVNGISPLNALRTSAYNGAKFLKQDAAYGHIEAGKIADLVLLDANPLENIKNTESIYMVIKEKSVFDKNKLQELLDSTIVK